MCTFCVHCGRCTGESKPMAKAGLCFICGMQNDPSTDVCSGCGRKLAGRPGSTVSYELPVR